MSFVKNLSRTNSYHNANHYVRGNVIYARSKNFPVRNWNSWFKQSFLLLLALLIFCDYQLFPVSIVTIILWIWDSDLMLFWLFLFTSKDKKYNILGLNWSSIRSLQVSLEITKEPPSCLMKSAIVKKHNKRVFANVCLPVCSDCIQPKSRIFPHVLFFGGRSCWETTCTPSAYRRTLSTSKQCANNGAHGRFFYYKL